MAETTESYAKRILTKAIKNLETRKELGDFLEDLLTPEELLDLGQRLRVAKYILAGETYEEIAEKANVSTSTVTKVGKRLKYGTGMLEKALEKRKKKDRT